MSYNPQKKLQRTALGSVLVSALGSMPVAAQQVERADPNEMEEVIVVGFNENLLKLPDSTATKMDVSLKDTGRSVIQLGATKMQELALENIREAFDYVAGFRGNGPADRTYTARGIRTSIDNVMVDGLRSLQGGEGGTGSRLPSTFNAESATFLRGPAGLLYGAGVGGGLVNITTKRPQNSAQTTLGINTRSYVADGNNFERNRANLLLDSTGPVNTDKVLYRVVAQYAPEGDHFQEGRSVDETMLDASMTFVLGENTRITPRIEYTSRDRTGGSGYADGVFTSNYFSADIVKYGKPLNRSYYYGSPDDKGENESLSFSLLLESKLNSNWNLRLRGRGNETDSESLDLYISDSSGLNNEVGNDTVNRKWVYAKGDDEYTLFDGALEGKFSTGTIDHHLVFGANYRDMTVKFARTFQDGDDAYGKNTISVTNPWNQMIGAIPAGFTDVTQSKQGEKDTNIYLKDRISIGDFTVVGGLSYVKQEQDQTRSGSNYSNSFSDTIWDMGVIYAVTPDINLFATYSRSYDPVNARWIVQYGDGATFEPIEGDNYELGMKGEFLDERLSTAVTAFKLERSSATDWQRGPDGWKLIQLSGTSFRSEGVELDATFAVTPSIRTSLSYAFTRAYNTKGDDINRQANNTPKHSAAFWSTYGLGGQWSDVRLGLGLRYEGERYDGQYTLDSYLEADAGIYYNSKQWDASLVIRNAFDKNRAEAGANWVTVQPNEPRSVNLSLKYRL